VQALIDAERDYTIAWIGQQGSAAPDSQ
jgi:hypothetical protein